MPSQDVSVRYIYQKSSTATGDLAAAMAQAARVYRLQAEGASITREMTVLR